MWIRIRIRNLDLDPRRSWIPNPDPQHCFILNIFQCSYFHKFHESYFSGLIFLGTGIVFKVHILKRWYFSEFIFSGLLFFLFVTYCELEIIRPTTVSDLYNYFTLLSVPTYGTHYTVPYLILKNEFYSNIGDLQAIFVPFIFMFKMSLLQGYFFLSKHFYPPPPPGGGGGGGLVLRTGWVILRLPPNHALCSPPTAKFNFLGEWNSITPQHESFRFFFCLKNQRYKIKEGFFYCYNRKWPKWNSSSLLRF